MKLKTEISDIGETEIIIRCNERTEKIKRIEAMLESVIQQGDDMVLTLGETEYYVSKKEILFFETEDGKVAAHTLNGMYYTDYKLYELEKNMPEAFVRISKSCIININKISAIQRNITGASEVRFNNTDKKVYASRAYYKILKDKLYEVRFNR